MSWKITEQLCVMALKTYAKLKKTDLSFQKLDDEFGEFLLKHWSLKIWTMLGSFCPKCMIFELKVIFVHSSTLKLYFMTLKSDTKFEEKLTCGLKNDMRNLMNFHPTTKKFENLHFDGLFLSKVCNVWAKKCMLFVMTLNNKLSPEHS